MEIQCASTLPDYTLHFFDSYYPKASDPVGQALASSVTGVGAPNGLISFSGDLPDLGLGGIDVDPAIYPIAEVASAGGGSSSAQAAPSLQNAGYFPAAGNWTVSYDIDAADYAKGDAASFKVFDPEDTRGMPIPGTARWPRWYHEYVAGMLHIDYLNAGWLSCGPAASVEVLYRDKDHQLRDGQTFPKRNGNPRDISVFKMLLSLNSVRNFYGNGHGDFGSDAQGHYPQDQFMWMSVGDYRALKLGRYRFVFLDGCFTAFCTDLSRSFGAAGFEFRDPPLQPLVVSDYKDSAVNKNKLWPAAFLGWLGEVPYCYRLQTPVEDCTYKHYTSRCNWHRELIFRWRDLDQTLAQAVNSANAVATLTFENSETARDWTKASVRVPTFLDGQWSVPMDANQTFNPQTHLRIYGCSDLRLRDYNSGPYKWPLP